MRMRQKCTYLTTDSSATIETSAVAENQNEFSDNGIYWQVCALMCGCRYPLLVVGYLIILQMQL